LVYTHAERTSTPPGRLRSLLERALHLFPSRRLFLALYIHWEARSRIENRLRRFFDLTLQRHASSSAQSRYHADSLLFVSWAGVYLRYNHPVLWLFAIRSEVVRLGSAHRIRSLFERALEKTSECVIFFLPTSAILLFRSCNSTI